MIRKFREGQSKADISKDLYINYQSVKTIIIKYQETWQILNNKRGAIKGGNRKIIEEAERMLESQLKYVNTMRYSDMKKFLHQNCDIRVSYGRIKNFLAENAITFKKAQNINERVNDEEIKL